MPLDMHGWAMKTLFMMRYSFFGNSGWRSDVSRDPGQLFSAQRLKRRYELLRDIALPSLINQDDQDFKLVILSSKLMPAWRKKQLLKLAHGVLGKDRVDVLFKPQMSAPLAFKSYLHGRYAADDLLTQIVLDDDDAVSRDFVGMIKREAQAAYDLRMVGKPFCFLSFPKGLSLDLAGETPEVSTRNIPFTNLGLSMVGPAGVHKNVYGIAHKNVARNNPARVIYTKQPCYVRTVHDTNDSKAVRGSTLIAPEKLPEMIEKFPFLQKFFPEAAPEAENWPMAA